MGSTAFITNTAALSQPRLSELSPVGGEVGRMLRGLVASRNSPGFSAASFLGSWVDTLQEAKGAAVPMPYELCVLRPFAEPLLTSVGCDEVSTRGTTCSLCLGQILTAPAPARGSSLGLAGLATSLCGMLTNFAAIDASVLSANSV